MLINTNSQMRWKNVEKNKNYSQSYSLKNSLGKSKLKRLFHTFHRP